MGKPERSPDDFYYYAKRGSWQRSWTIPVSHQISSSLKLRDFQKDHPGSASSLRPEEILCDSHLWTSRLWKSTVCDQLIRALRKIGRSPATSPTIPSNGSQRPFQSLYQSVCPEETIRWSSWWTKSMVSFGRLARDVARAQVCCSASQVPDSGQNKNRWNTFMDKIDKGRWKHLIFVMTTNLTLAQIDALDSSYTRLGRCDLRVWVGTAEAVPGCMSNSSWGWSQLEGPVEAEGPCRDSPPLLEGPG